MAWRSPVWGLRVAVLASASSKAPAAADDSGFRAGREVQRALADGGYTVEVFDAATIGVEHVAWEHYDACFLAMPGPHDGRWQRELTARGIPHTGSREAVCRIAASRAATRQRWEQRGLAVAPFALMSTLDVHDEFVARAEQMGWPVGVVADRVSSSCVPLRAEGPDELGRVVAQAERDDVMLVLEPWRSAPEFTVVVLGRLPLAILPRSADAARGSSPERRPPLNGDERQRFESLAAAAADSLGTSGLVTVDVLRESTDAITLLSANVAPELIEGSSAVVAAHAAGLDLAGLCDWMVRDCLVTELTR
jgi:D-alanine-D-alanine ligase-like ATP-grasp enzyme